MFTASSSTGGTLKERLTGAAIIGVVPEGQALADESRFPSGGDTSLTVQVKKVNLADGTILGVSIDFKPLGSITLTQGAGTLTVNLGRARCTTPANGFARMPGSTTTTRTTSAAPQVPRWPNSACRASSLNVS